MSATIDALCVGLCPELDLEVFRATVRVQYAEVPAYGDGWNEPHEPAHVLFECAYIDGKRVPEGPLLTWAVQWFDLQQIEPGVDRPDPDAARERMLDDARDAA